MNDLQERTQEQTGLDQVSGLREVKPKSRRDRVKNIAIIFLAVMLVFTFFSNTIMNWSLPEVSGQYAGNGSITTSIRGTGTVAANMAYSVQLDATRQIKTVYVKAGDTVTAGQVLFALEDMDSAELKEARATLTTMEYDYNTKLLQAVGADYSTTNQQIANLQTDLQKAISAQGEAATNKAALDAAKAAVRRAEDVVASLSDQITALNDKITEVSGKNAAGIPAMTAAIAALNQATAQQTIAKNAYDLATERVTELTGELASGSASQDDVTAAQRKLETQHTELLRLQEDYRAMQDGKDAYDDALADYQDAQADLNRLGISETVTEDAVKAAQRAVEEAQTNVRYAQEDLDALRSSNSPVYNEEGNITGYEPASDSQITAAERKLEAAQDALRTAQDDLDDKEAAYRASADYIALKDEADEAKQLLDSLTAVTDAQLLAAQREVEDLQAAITQQEEDLRKLTSSLQTTQSQNTAINAAKAAQAEAKANLNVCDAAVTVAETALDTTAKQQTELLKAQLDDLKTQQTAANRAVEDAQLVQTDLSSKPTDEDAAADAVTAAQRALADAAVALQAQQSQDNVEAQVTQLSLQRDAEAIEEQKALVEKLAAKNTGTEVASKYDGTIAKLNVVSGDTVNAGDELAAIDVEGKGYTLSLTVTQEQSRQVHVGDKATVSNYWWGNLDVTLSAIKADRNNPGQNKILEFTVSGDVTDGQSLDVSVGERQTNYDLVVPNSAIREDANGTFILVATAKSTPLSTRYSATRVDVTVLAKDSYNAAIDAGSSYGYEYVITTSTKPLEAGSQVRLVES